MTTIAPAMIARTDRLVTVLREHGLILTDPNVAALALQRVDIIDRIGAAPAGSLLRSKHRVNAAARTIFADYDELPETSPERGTIRKMVGDALQAAG